MFKLGIDIHAKYSNVSHVELVEESEETLTDF